MSNFQICNSKLTVEVYLDSSVSTADKIIVEVSDSNKVLDVIELPISTKDYDKLRAYKRVTALINYAKKHRIVTPIPTPPPSSRPPEASSVAVPLDSSVDADGDTPIYTFNENHLCTCCEVRPIAKYDYCPECYENITGNELDPIVYQDYQDFIHKLFINATEAELLGNDSFFALTEQQLRSDAPTPDDIPIPMRSTNGKHDPKNPLGYGGYDDISPFSGSPCALPDNLE